MRFSLSMTGSGRAWLTILCLLASSLGHTEVSSEDADAIDPASHTEQLMEAGEYARAADVARRYIEANPEAPLLWNTLGEALLATGKLDEASRAFKRSIESYDPDRLTAELNLARIRYRRGETAQAFAEFERVLDYYRAQRSLSPGEFTAVATAAAYLGKSRAALYQGAVQLYGQAIALNPDDLKARVALGNLLLEKYNNAEAQDLFREVLAAHPEQPDALLGLARSQHFDHSIEATETVKLALAANPHLVPARAFLARLHIESEQYGEARDEALRALETDPRSLEALAVLAATHYLTRDEAALEDVTRRVLALNPKYAELYNTLAELAARNRRYEDAITLAERAISLDARSSRAYGLLGMNQLRVGKIDEGRASLEKAFAADPYNVWIKNTLDLADTFGQYDLVPAEHFEFMVHDDEADVLAPFLYPLAEEIFKDFVDRYDYRPKAPIRIELYPRHADFSVRSVGLAGVGLLGVSFGPVVAMDSASAREKGNFNWGSTLRHELAHSFHLGLTEHRVPRWFTEGLAVHEEHRGPIGWGGDVTPDFLVALRDEKLKPVSQLNDGFVRPSYPQQVIHSYYQASLVLEYIESEWGFEAVRAMLNGFKERASTAEVMQRVLGVDAAEFDQRFDGFIKQRFAERLQALADPASSEEDDVIARAEKATNIFALQLEAGHALLEQRDRARAETFLLRARDLFPEYAGDDSPYWFLARLYREQGEVAKAVEQLERMAAINAEHYEAHVGLAELKQSLGDTRGVVEILERAIYIYPFDIELHQALADAYMQLGDWAHAARARAAIVALGPTDMARARLELAEATFRAGDAQAARREVLRALELAPDFEAAQELLLEIRTQTRPGPSS